MKIVKRVAIVLVILIAVLLVMALFIDGKYTVDQEVIINSPREQVFNYISHLKNHENYNKWSMMDPGAKMESKGQDGTVGFINSWDSEITGKGEQEIKSIKENERIDIQIRFIKPFEGIAETYMSTESIGDKTKVKWHFASEMPYPMNLMLVFMDMNDHMGKDLNESLQNLKINLEK